MFLYTIYLLGSENKSHD